MHHFSGPAAATSVTHTEYTTTVCPFLAILGYVVWAAGAIGPTQPSDQANTDYRQRYITH